MNADVAFRHVTASVRSVNVNADTHEVLAQALAVIREQLVAFATLYAAHKEEMITETLPAAPTLEPAAVVPATEGA
jgi:hypothetical protein